jgi:hypothetical protein
MESCRHRVPRKEGATPPDDIYTFHRKLPGNESDRLIGEGTKDEMLDRYARMRPALIKRKAS